MRKHEIKVLKMCVLLAMIVLGCLICLGSYLHYKKYHFIDKGKLVARVADYKIYEKDLEPRLGFLSDKFGKEAKLSDLDEEVVKAILLERYIDYRIFNMAKKKDNLNDLKFLKEDYYKKLAVNHYIENFVFKTISEEEVKERYDELVEKLGDKEEREIYHILLPTEEEAGRVLNQIKRNNNFETVAQRRSMDKASAIRGGNIGYVLKEELTIPEFADIVFLLKENEISKPIKTKEGWHIVKVNNVRMVKAKRYEDSKDKILENLRKERYDQFLQSLELDKIENNIILLGKNNSNLNVKNAEQSE
jgi:parvulin-like peptidyl-prolyl isomerase